MKSFFALFIFTFTIVSCSRVSEDELLGTAQNAYQQKKYQEAIQYYEELVDRFPDGNHTEQALLILATLYNDELQDYHKAIAAYRRLRELRPDGEKAPMALFLIGFIYNNHLQKPDSARITYEEFLAKYPTHQMAASAKFEVDNLGKNPEELIRPKVVEKEKSSSPKRKKK